MKRLLAVVLALAPPSAAAEPCPIPRLTTTRYDDIRQLLERSPPVVTSTETFLDCLPDTFFEQGNLSYVTESRSPERASVSPAFPRTILFGETAETVIAYTGDPRGPHADEVRIIANDEESPPGYRFVSIAFPGNDLAPRIEESDESCYPCHKGHLIWANYRDWEGTFGPQSDLAWQTSEREQYDEYLAFLESRADSPRYARGIERARGDSKHPRSPGRFTPRNPYTPGTGEFLRKLAPGHARFVKGRLEESPHYPFYRFLLAATFLGCDWGPRVEADFNARVVAPFRSEVAGTEYRSYGRRLARDPGNTYFRNLRSVSRLAMLGRVLGVSLDEWSTELTASRETETLGPSFDLASGIEIRDFVFRHWIAELGREFESIGRAFSSPKWDPETKYSSFLNPRYRDRAASADPHHEEECRTLLPFVEAEVDYRELAGEAAAATRPAGERAHRVEESLPAAFESCSACHAGGRDYAPAIPTGSAVELSDWLNEDRNRQILVRRVLVERNMPPGGMSAVERDQVRRFVE